MPDAATRYLQIADEIRKRIHLGAEGYEPGAQIPGEDVLANEFECGTGTAAKAMDVLRRERLVHSQARHGTFVRATPPVRRLTANRFNEDIREAGRGAFDVELRNLGYQYRTDWLKFGRYPCPSDDDPGNQDTTASLLELEPGADVMVRARWMFGAPFDQSGRVNYALEEPIQLATSFIPWDVAEKNPGHEPEAGRRGEPGIVVRDTGVGGLYSRIRDAGHRVVQAQEWVTGRVGSPDESKLLAMMPASTVMTVDRQAFDADGRVVEVCRHVFPPENFVLGYKFAVK